MLDRAIATVRELREQARITPLVGRDALIYVQTVSIRQSAHREWRHGLLHAA